MATVLFTAVANSFALEGIALALAQTAAVVAGGLIDQQIFAGNRSTGIPQIDEVGVTTASETAPVPYLFGTSRIPGNVIWTQKFEQHGDGVFLTFAVAFCKANGLAEMRKIWANGEEVNWIFDHFSSFSYRTYDFYNGAPNQSVDRFIQETEGAEYTPAYRGVCYAIFKKIFLKDFGNRMPQITAEISNPFIRGHQTVRLDSLIKEICLLGDLTEEQIDVS